MEQKKSNLGAIKTVWAAVKIFFPDFWSKMIDDFTIFFSDWLTNLCLFWTSEIRNFLQRVLDEICSFYIWKIDNFCNIIRKPPDKIYHCYQWPICEIPNFLPRLTNNFRDFSQRPIDWFIVNATEWHCFSTANWRNLSLPPCLIVEIREFYYRPIDEFRNTFRQMIQNFHWF